MTAVPTVSIITGLFNSAPYLSNYFDALHRQTFTNWEALLVDDGSTDATVALVKEQCAKDPRYRLIQKSPEGFPSRSRQRGLDEARGQYVAFCDHDDLWAPQKLALQVAAMRRFPDTAILHTDRVVWTSEKRPHPYFHFVGHDDEAPISLQLPQEVLYRGQRIIFSSFMTTRALLAPIGFHAQMLGVDDFYLFLRLSSRGAIRHIELPLTYYAAHVGNLSHTSNIFVRGLHLVHQTLKSDDVSDELRRSVWAQACRTEAVSLLATDRRRALGLLVESLRSYFMPTTLNRLAFLLVTFFVPQTLQESLLKATKRLKFMFPTLKDLLRR